MSDTNTADNTDAIVMAQHTLQSLLSQQESLVLATVNTDGSPLASYTPFVVDPDKTFYIFVSMLSHHTVNLLQAEQASVMLIADEAETSQIFARSRLTFTCRVEELARDTEAWQTAAGHYEERFSKMFSLLRTLGDFKM
ncbi:MAG: pyridoxamine 5'-phosphate oxidase family protein, partial [Chloroflexota bacterium]